MVPRMKVVTSVVVIIICLATVAFGQDSTQIRFTEEADTLFAKQRFIDQYEAVFMTRVPTRHMFKYGSAIYPVNNILFNPNRIGILTAEVGYEFKISSAISIGANVSLTNKATKDPQSFKTYSANIQGRWYFDMKKRIREGRSANNFSGNYFAVSYNTSKKSPSQSPALTNLGIEFGVQRRLFNDGRIDFAIGLGYQKYRSDYFIEEAAITTEFIKDIALATHTSLGGAFGDWKRTDHLPICEILHCDQELNKQWKILWPNIYLSSRIRKTTFALGYERKLGKSPLSLNAQAYFDYRDISLIPKAIYPNFKDQFYQIHPSLQMRYYVLQKYAMRRGLGGNNLSGVYLGPLVDYIDFKSKFGSEENYAQHLGPGAVFCFKKTLFQRIYFDFSGSWSWNTLHANPGSKTSQSSLRIGLGWAI
jgi:hypothetical protein